MSDSQCDWCGGRAQEYERFRFDIGGYSGRRYWHEAPICMVHWEHRTYGEYDENGKWHILEGYNPPHIPAPRYHETSERRHACLCGHTSQYHKIHLNRDHGWEAHGTSGAVLCRPCAKFVAAATRRRLGRTDSFHFQLRENAVELEEIDDLFEDPLRDLTDGEVAEAARKFFRQYERAAKVT